MLLESVAYEKIGIFMWKKPLRIIIGICICLMANSRGQCMLMVAGSVCSRKMSCVCTWSMGRSLAFSPLLSIKTERTKRCAMFELPWLVGKKKTARTVWRICCSRKMINILLPIYFLICFCFHHHIREFLCECASRHCSFYFKFGKRTPNEWLIANFQFVCSFDTYFYHLFV